MVILTRLRFFDQKLTCGFIFEKANAISVGFAASRLSDGVIGRRLSNPQPICHVVSLVAPYA